MTESLANALSHGLVVVDGGHCRRNIRLSSILILSPRGTAAAKETQRTSHPAPGLGRGCRSGRAVERKGTVDGAEPAQVGEGLDRRSIGRRHGIIPPLRTLAVWGQPMGNDVTPVGSQPSSAG